MTIKTVTRTYGDGTTESRILLTADNGKALTNDGETLFNCVEVVSADGWTEVDAPATDEPLSDTEAFRITTGGTA